MIEVRDLQKSFGGVRAVRGCSFTVPTGSITALIGPNGAGKTTVFNIIAGFLRPDAGRVLLDGEDVTGLAPHRLYRRGLVRTFQIPRMFDRMTVLESLLVPPVGQLGENLFHAWFSRDRVRRQEAKLVARAREVLDLLGLRHLEGERAGHLSGGQKKLVELGRVLMSPCRTVLLDEPGAGVNRTLLSRIVDLIRRLNREAGYTFCIVEHDMDLVARLCDPVIVMAEGRVLTQGRFEDIRRNREVIDAYLGAVAVEEEEA